MAQPLHVPSDRDAPPARLVPLGGATRPLRILYVGQLAGTSLQRAEALRALGHEVIHLPSSMPPASGSWRDVLVFQVFRALHRIRRYPDVHFSNARTLRQARRGGFDVLWVDKGLTLRPRTLRRVRALLPGARLVSYSPDDMANPDNQSRRYLESLPLYDLHVTTKSFNVVELQALGAREVLPVPNAFDPAVHRPLRLGPAERLRFAADVGFVGHFEPERAETMLELARRGIRVCVRGPGWRRFGRSHPNLRVHDEYLHRDDYARAVCATKINLGFLCKANRDLQTTRSVEIPACGGFLLAERTDEHRALFREGREAEFFGSFDELLSKCRHYLARDAERRRVARAGLRRCRLGGYSNQQRLARVLERVLERPARGAKAGRAPLPLPRLSRLSLSRRRPPSAPRRGGPPSGSS